MISCQVMCILSIAVWMWRNGRRAWLRAMWETVRVRVPPSTPFFFTKKNGNTNLPVWRNWQTRGIQNPVIEISYGFDPHHRYHYLILIDEFISGYISFISLIKFKQSQTYLTKRNSESKIKRREIT